MTGIRWTCHCEPITATGSFRSGQWRFTLHGPGCDRPLLRRRTIVYRLDARRAR